METESRPAPYVPHGEGRLRYSEEGHAVLVYPDRLTEMPPGGVRVPLGLFRGDDAILSLAPLTLIARTSDRVIAERASRRDRDDGTR